MTCAGRPGKPGDAIKAERRVANGKAV